MKDRLAALLVAGAVVGTSIAACSGSAPAPSGSTTPVATGRTTESPLHATPTPSLTQARLVLSNVVVPERMPATSDGRMTFEVRNEGPDPSGPVWVWLVGESERALVGVPFVTPGDGVRLFDWWDDGGPRNVQAVTLPSLDVGESRGYTFVLALFNRADPVTVLVSVGQGPQPHFALELDDAIAQTRVTDETEFTVEIDVGT
jgi:hypothetical protein